MRVFSSDRFTISLPARHRFPMRKYALLRERIERSNDARIRFEAAPAATRDQLASAHDPVYVERVFAGSLTSAELRKLGFPWSAALVERSRRSVGATLAAVEAACEEGVAASLAGGTHHASRAAGAGFCVFNDVAVAAVSAAARDPHRRVLVVDCDVHQGDGTARILAAHDGLMTFSIHSARNYPHDKAVSDWDIALPDGTGDASYLEHLELGLRHAFAAARPHVVLYLSGADAFSGDRLGRLDLSKAGLARRDALVFDHAGRAGAAIAVVMGGGYADPIEDAVDVHAATVRAATQAWSVRRAG